jgi:hypothetical protein
VGKVLGGAPDVRMYLKGGSYDSRASEIDLGSRNVTDVDNSDNESGFRCVLDAPGAADR